MWTIILGLLANPLVIKVALTLIDVFMAKAGADAATVAALQKVADFLQKNGVAKAAVSYSAETQIAQGDQMWKDRENQTPPTKPTGG